MSVNDGCEEEDMNIVQAKKCLQYSTFDDSSERRMSIDISTLWKNGPTESLVRNSMHLQTVVDIINSHCKVPNELTHSLSGISRSDNVVVSFQTLEQMWNLCFPLIRHCNFIVPDKSEDISRFMQLLKAVFPSVCVARMFYKCYKERPIVMDEIRTIHVVPENVFKDIQAQDISKRWRQNAIQKLVVLKSAKDINHTTNIRAIDRPGSIYAFPFCQRSTISKYPFTSVRDMIQLALAEPPSLQSLFEKKYMCGLHMIPDRGFMRQLCRALTCKTYPFQLSVELPLFVFMNIADLSKFSHVSYAVALFDKLCFSSTQEHIALCCTAKQFDTVVYCLTILSCDCTIFITDAESYDNLFSLIEQVEDYRVSKNYTNVLSFVVYYKNTMSAQHLQSIQRVLPANTAIFSQNLSIAKPPENNTNTLNMEHVLNFVLSLPQCQGHSFDF